MRFHLEKNHHQPLFQQLEAALRKEIIEGRLKAGDALPSLQELTQLTGVSVFTVDRAVNALIKEGLLIRRPKKGTYVSKKVGAPLSGTARKRIVFAASAAHQIESSPRTYYGLIYMGILDAAVGAGVHIIPSSPENLISDIRLYDQQEAFDVRGMIFVDDWHKDYLTEVANECPQKTLIATNAKMADFETTPDNVHGVFNDDFGGGYALGAALAESGILRCWIFSRAMPVDNYRMRVEGMKQAFADAGRPIPKNHIFESDEPPGKPNELIIQGLLQNLPMKGLQPTDAILCVNDQLAIGVLRFLNERMGELSKTPLVTGYDGLLSSSQDRMAFPSVKVDFDRLGRTSLDLLLRDHHHNIPKTVAIPAQFLPRGVRFGKARLKGSLVAT